MKKFHKQLQYEGATAWKALGRRNPTVWTADEVMNYLKTLKPGAASGALDAIRQIAPQISNRHSRHYICTSIVTEKLKRHKKDIFAMEVGMIIMALRCKGLTWHETVFKLHVTLGAREGKTNPDAGMSGLLWSYAKKKFAKMDL